MPPQNMLLWQIDYFELKALIRLQDARRALGLSFFLLKAGNKIPMAKVPSLYWEEETLLSPETGSRS